MAVEEPEEEREDGAGGQQEANAGARGGSQEGGQAAGVLPEAREDAEPQTQPCNESRR